MDKRILVVGDIMLDKYTVGDVERISPEAPVPIVKVTNEYSSLGGCGNVVRNIASLGVEVDCVASIGRDFDGEAIEVHLDKCGVGDYLVCESEVTTVKERIVANSRKIQMVRVDRETTQRVNPDKLKQKLEMYFDVYSPEIVIVSDYLKGVVSMDLMVYLRKKAKKIIVDPKPGNGHVYGGVFMITPNENEWKEMMITTPQSDLRDMRYVLITKGKLGMTLFDFNQSWDIPAEDIHQIYNVSGAGDTVVATMAVSLINGFRPVVSARIANACAGHVVTEPGTSVVPPEIYKECVHKYGGKNGS